MANDCFGSAYKPRDLKLSFDYLIGDVDYCPRFHIEDGSNTPEWLSNGGAYRLNTIARSLNLATQFKNHEALQANALIFREACIGAYILAQKAAIIFVDQSETYQRLAKLFIRNCRHYTGNSRDPLAVANAYIRARSEGFPSDLLQEIAQELAQSAYHRPWNLNEDIRANLELNASHFAIRAIAAFPRVSKDFPPVFPGGAEMTFRMALSIADNATQRFDLKTLRLLAMSMSNRIAGEIGDSSLEKTTRSAIWEISLGEKGWTARLLAKAKQFITSPSIGWVIFLLLIFFWCWAMYDRSGSYSPSSSKFLIVKKGLALFWLEAVALVKADSKLSLKERWIVFLISALITNGLQSLRNTQEADFREIKLRVESRFKND